jgi:hypothetical protein
MARQALFASVFNGVKRINASSTKQCQRQNGRKIGENGLGEPTQDKILRFLRLLGVKSILNQPLAIAASRESAAFILECSCNAFEAAISLAKQCPEKTQTIRVSDPVRRDPA